MNDSITFTFPLTRPHCGVPLANGDFGVLVWGRETLNVTVNQSSLWDHRGGQLIDERDRYAALADYAREHGCDRGLSKMLHRERAVYGSSRRLAVGRFEFTFPAGITPRKAVLDYHTGQLHVQLSDNSELTLVVVLKHNILYLEDSAQRIAGVKCVPASDYPSVRQFNADREMGEYGRLPDGWRIALPQDPAYTIRSVKTSYGWKIFPNAESEDGEREKELAFTAEWWGNFCSRTARVTTPDSWWNAFYDFSLYKLAAATCPYGRAAGLQGPWHEEYQEAKWSGDYHFNVNVQMIYGPLCRLGLAEHQLPLFDMIESAPFQESMRHNARALFGVEDALWQTHAVDDLGRQCGGIGTGAILDPACGAWTALLYYDHFRHTGDAEFLRERAWPYIFGIMRGYEEMLDEGLNIPVAVSAEYASSNQNMTAVAGRNPSYQLAAVRKLAAILIELSAYLKRPERPVWRKILEKVPHFTTTAGYDSYAQRDEPRIAIWEGQDLEVCHRHHSHLGCIWPFDSLPENPSPEILSVVENSIAHWISMGIGKWSEWCIPWANIIYTRMELNEAPMQLFTLWREIFVNEGLATVYLPRMLSLIAHRRHDIAAPREQNEVMQLDGCGGFLDAFTQMCAYTRGGELRLFRGMPEKWSDVRIDGLCLPGGGRLSASRSGETRLEPGSASWRIS